MESDKFLVNQLSQATENKAASALQDLRSHGLSRSEPLALESIIRGCFSNPDRTKFPNFMSIKCVDSVPLYTQN